MLIVILCVHVWCTKDNQMGQDAAELTQNDETLPSQASSCVCVCIIFNRTSTCGAFAATSRPISFTRRKKMFFRISCVTLRLCCAVLCLRDMWGCLYIFIFPYWYRRTGEGKSIDQNDSHFPHSFHLATATSSCYIFIGWPLWLGRAMSIPFYGSVHSIWIEWIGESCRHRNQYTGCGWQKLLSDLWRIECELDGKDWFRWHDA